MWLLSECGFPIDFACRNIAKGDHMTLGYCDLLNSQFYSFLGAAGLHLLPGMSSDSDIECDTENDEQEEAETTFRSLHHKPFVSSASELCSLFPETDQLGPEDLPFDTEKDSAR
uniref:Uncharacterized protein n=1 Tax=Laticauda laticaudata TaxID=8630 RepID=A0A8C5RR84_LATLA